MLRNDECYCFSFSIIFLNVLSCVQNDDDANADADDDANAKHNNDSDDIFLNEDVLRGPFMVPGIILFEDYV